MKYLIAMVFGILLCSTAARANGKRSKPLYWKMSGSGSPTAKNSYHWVAWATVHEQWKVLANRDSSHVELYDIVADPLEQKEIGKEQPEVVARLLEQLAAWKDTLPAHADQSLFSAERTK